MELFTYCRSVAAHRVRIVFNYKAIPYSSKFVRLESDGGAAHQFRALNPQGLAPVLVHDGQVITQSMAIMEYLEEQVATRPMMPAGCCERARVRSLAQMFISDIQPLHSMRVLRYLRDRQAMSEQQLDEWFEYWTRIGLEAAEVRLSSESETGVYCHGDQPTLADACLVPEVHLAMQRGQDLSAFPTVRRIYRTCMTLGSFQAAAPETQLDAMPEPVQILSA